MSDLDTYQLTVKACALARAILQSYDVPKTLRDIEHAEAVGPIFDPALWREKSQAMAEDKALLQAALALATFQLPGKERTNG